MLACQWVVYIYCLSGLKIIILVLYFRGHYLTQVLSERPAVVPIHQSYQGAYGQCEYAQCEVECACQHTVTYVLAGPQGLEPQTVVPKTTVIPFHQGPMCATCVGLCRSCFRPHALSLSVDPGQCSLSLCSGSHSL